MPQDDAHVPEGDRDAACRWAAIGPAEMEEHRAAMALDPGALIVRGFDHNVIEVVLRFIVSCAVA